MIHGNTRIVLRNPLSNHIIKDVESENTFQGGVIAQGHKSLGSVRAGSYLLESNNTPFWQYVIGGIFLFQSSITIPSGSSVAYMPSGNKMIANGAYNVLNNGTPVELGSWNDTEKVITSSSMKLVYDWGTSQGNGTISCVSLTSATGGYIGYGNPSGTKSSTLKTLWTNQPVQRPTFNNNGRYGIRGICGNKQYDFNCPYPFETFTVTKQRIPLTQASVFDTISDSGVTIDTSSLHGSNIWGQYGVVCAQDNGKFYFTGLYSSAQIVSGGSMYIWEYNPSNDTITEITVRNTISPATNINIRSITVSQGKVFVKCAGATTCYVFNLSDSTYIGSFDDVEGTTTLRNALAGNLSSGLSVIENDYDYISIYDHTNGTCYPTNGSGQQHEIYYDSTTDALCFNDEYNTIAFNNPFYLATINNLSSSVTKDASLTMKVEYTLSEA